MKEKKFTGLPKEIRTGWAKCPTLGDVIDKVDSILKGVPSKHYQQCAEAFKGTLIEEIIFSGESFEKEASQWTRDNFWTEPS